MSKKINNEKSVSKKTVNKTVTPKKKEVSVKEAIAKYLSERNNKIIVGNWKMNKKFDEIKTYCSIFNQLLRKDKCLSKTNTLIGIAPTTIGLLPLAGMIKNNVITVAQHVSGETHGALTGQVSFEQIREYNINYSLVGHSETRTHLGVTNRECNAIVTSLSENNMMPILCVGDTYEEYKENNSEKAVKLQLINCLKGLTEEQILRCVIAYEPVWAIGAYSATPSFIKKMISSIRSTIASLYSSEIAKKMHVLYGGSVKPDNAETILAIPGVDGALIGGSSLDPNDFYKICISTPEYKRIKHIIVTKNGTKLPATKKVKVAKKAADKKAKTKKANIKKLNAKKAKAEKKAAAKKAKLEAKKAKLAKKQEKAKKSKK